MPSIGLWVERDFASDIETQDLAQRVGSLAGKIAISMNRRDAANQPQLAQDLLAPLGHEPSVVCAEYQAGGQLVARYPQGLGCRNAVFDDSVDLHPVGLDRQRRFSSGQDLHAQKSPLSRASFVFGTRGRTRTGTLLRATDFESVVSTNFTTLAMAADTTQACDQ